MTLSLFFGWSRCSPPWQWQLLGCSLRVYSTSPYMVTSAARLLAWYRSSCAKPWLTVKWRWTDINFADGETREYICSKPQAIFLRHVVAGKSAVQQIDWCLWEMYHSLDSRAVDDSAVRTIAHHGSTKPQDGFPLPSIRIFLDQRKSLLSKDIREEAGHGAHSLDFHFPESEQSPLHGRRCCHRVFTVLCWRDMAEMHKIVGYRARLWGLSLLILLFDPFCRPVLSKCFN
jgi:hypothetical protein